MTGDVVTARARIDAAFKRYQMRPRPSGGSVLDSAYERGDTADSILCYLVGWLTGLAESERPITRERVAEAVEFAVGRAIDTGFGEQEVGG